MATGLYFPHTVCNDKSLLKSALFLFDELEYIVPDREYPARHPPADPQVRETLELIGVPIVPTENEQKAAHKEIEQVCKGKIAKHLNFQPRAESEQYLIFPQKFDWKTWELLRKKKLAAQLGEENDYDFTMTTSLGLFMMAMLALSCAKREKQLVTDNPDAFKALYLASADDVQPTALKMDDVRQRLLNIRMKSFNVPSVPFARLLDLRSKEDAFLRELRTNYLATHKDCLDEIETVSDNPREIERCVARYAQKAEEGLKELKRALRINAAKTLLSNTIISTVVGMIGSKLTNPAVGYLASSGVLAGQLFDYQDKRRELLKKHKFAWLYEVGTRFKLY